MHYFNHIREEIASEQITIQTGLVWFQTDHCVICSTLFGFEFVFLDPVGVVFECLMECFYSFALVQRLGGFWDYF